MMTSRLGVDPVRCEGIGMCAHLAPDLISVDPWGFPVVSKDAIAQHEQRSARAAVRGCPRRALFMDQVVEERLSR